MTMQLSLTGAAFGCYAAATALAFVYIFLRNEKVSLWMLHLLGAGLAFQQPRARLP